MKDRERLLRYYGKAGFELGLYHFHLYSTVWKVALFLGFHGGFDVPMRLLSFVTPAPFCAGLSTLPATPSRNITVRPSSLDSEFLLYF